MDTNETIHIEVAYAQIHKQMIIPLNVLTGTTIEQAIDISGIVVHFPEINIQKSNVGIFGRPATLTTVLQEGDRIEIYRPLIADPKAIRKQRAAEGKPMKKGG